jgi:hypothetical protein
MVWGAENRMLVDCKDLFSQFIFGGLPRLTSDKVLFPSNELLKVLLGGHGGVSAFVFRFSKQALHKLMRSQPPQRENK